MKTPFTLTGSASDVNGDALTYTWEELDLGDPAPPNDDVAAVRPTFQSFPPSGLPWRTLPKPSDLLGNTTTLGESLPTRTNLWSLGPVLCRDVSSDVRRVSRSPARSERLNGCGT